MATSCRLGRYRRLYPWRDGRDVVRLGLVAVFCYRFSRWIDGHRHLSGVGQEIIKVDAKTAAGLVAFFAMFNGGGRPVFGFLTDALGTGPSSSPVLCARVAGFRIDGALCR